MTSSWKPFRPNTPKSGDAEQVKVDATRAAFMALASAIVTGAIVPGWNFTTSVARGEASPGTADKPARAYYNIQAGDTTVWVKCVLTWDGNDNVSKVALYWSDDNEKSYDTMRDEAGNFVITIAYDVDQNVVSATWGSTP